MSTDDELRLAQWRASTWESEARLNDELIAEATSLLERVEQWATGSTTFPGVLLDQLRLWLGPKKCGGCQTTGRCTVHRDPDEEEPAR